MARNLVWLGSYPKSGNTWARLFLANLIADGDQPIDINQIGRYITSDGDKIFYRSVIGEAIDDLSEGEVNRYRPEVHRFIAESDPGYQFLKTHSSFAILDGVPTITREYTKCAVYFVRNPLDVAVSYAHHMNRPFEEIVDFMANPSARTASDDHRTFQFLGTWSKHVEAWATAKDLAKLVIRYEDIVQDPERSFASMCRFLGMPLDLPRIRKAISFSSFERSSTQEAQSGFVERLASSKRFFRKGQIGSWRSELSARLARRIVSQHREVMQRLGYLDIHGKPVF